MMCHPEATKSPKDLDFEILRFAQNDELGVEGKIIRK